MGWIEGLLTTLGVNKLSALFGLIGAGLHALRDSDKHWAERVVSFATGFVFAALAPAFIIAWFDLKANPAYFGGLGFVCGYFGMALIDAGSVAVAALKAIDWKELISGWLGKKG